MCTNSIYVIPWNGNAILTKFSWIAALKVVIWTIFSAGSGDFFVQMISFSFQCFGDFIQMSWRLKSPKTRSNSLFRLALKSPSSLILILMILILITGPLCADYTTDRMLLHTKGQRFGECLHTMASSLSKRTYETSWGYMKRSSSTAWGSYQMRKIVGCACAGNAGNVFPATTG